MYTPRHMRRSHRKSGAPKDPVKKMAFRRCARISRQFINQSASALESPALKHKYAMYCAATIDGRGFRR